MNCKQARQLFDAYLDGELSPGLATELGAHRVHCAECRRALALMEVSGHLIASDTDPSLPQGILADRLIACMDKEPTRRRGRWRRGLYIAGPLAAAAVIALAFLGVFDYREVRVAGHTERVDDSQRASAGVQDKAGKDPGLRVESVDERLLREWIEQTGANVATKVESGESFQEVLELTVSQLLDILEKSRDESSGEDHYPGAGAEAPLVPVQSVPTDDKEVEDL